MLLEELAQKQKEKPAVDWNAYLKWQVKENGGIPVVWVCECAQVNQERLPLREYLKCSSCGVIHPVHLKS